MEALRNYFTNLDLHADMAAFLSYAIATLLIVLLSFVANLIVKKIILRMIALYITRNRFQWDNKLLERQVFQKLSHIVPAIIIYYASFIYADYPAASQLIEKGALVYMILMILSALNAFMNAVNDIYQTYEVSKEKPIKGYIQVAKIILFFVGAILLVATLIGQNPLILLGGLGAISAVLMLVFQNSILGLVAGIQLTANDMIRVGDWIEMPKYNADGDVIEITLNTVKVQNWDKTITMIPSYAFISDSFRNWRGMQEAGGRRIKRSLYVDMTSISFCSAEMIEQFKQIRYLKDYIVNKEQEIEAYHREHEIDDSSEVNGRRLTNIGTYRIYISRYLENHPKIHKNLTSMVRQLAPGEYGLPLEIYTFTNDIRWGEYEAIQADIFDHIIAVAPKFGLRVFQNPTGHDMRSMLGDPVRQMT
ncbi:mechanosensitive ion channel family protein [Xylanibacillus composti]|uniref:Mechanosensing system component YbdG n=1 Tax=Xylanibacillus composti TaxID=1572762 RepID=A0A8J4M468_9BACL|nr:mechanosensitive ion channel domain-containing protein [Xylanibacillus composti]MDT9723743.1 mechanosensitive ion channel family protein [Xylanibacillus composti]GIQ70790.1 membrane protein [Xylanibacillus composti]